MAYEARPADASLRDPLPDSPLPTLARWLRQAAESGVRDHDAMALATVDAAGEPSVRFVLGRGFDPDTGDLSFYTSYGSDKAREIDARGVASAVFHWNEPPRQARLSGPVVRASAEQSDAYWATRDRASRIAARASRQSRPVASRAALLAQVEEEARAFGGVEGTEPIPRPEGWGGYVLRPRRVELWVGSRGRVHDRVRWERELPDGAWRHARLQP